MKMRINTHGNPFPVSKGDWIDLYTSEEVSMKQGEFRIIPLGISVEIPEGYTGYLLPRSSTYKNFKIIMANSIGVIDNSYCGDDDILGFAAIAMKDTMIPKGIRICQFCIMPSPEEIEFEEVGSLNNESRGGFGSTGVN